MDSSESDSDSMATRLCRSNTAYDAYILATLAAAHPSFLPPWVPTTRWLHGPDPLHCARLVAGLGVPTPTSFERDLTQGNAPFNSGSDAVRAALGSFPTKPLLFFPRCGSSSDHPVLREQYGLLVASDRALSSACIERVEGRFLEYPGFRKPMSVAMSTWDAPRFSVEQVKGNVGSSLAVRIGLYLCPGDHHSERCRAVLPSARSPALCAPVIVHARRPSPSAMMIGSSAATRAQVLCGALPLPIHAHMLPLELHSPGFARALAPHQAAAVMLHIAHPMARQCVLPPRWSGTRGHSRFFSSRSTNVCNQEVISQLHKLGTDYQSLQSEVRNNSMSIESISKSVSQTRLILFSSLGVVASISMVVWLFQQDIKRVIDRKATEVLTVRISEGFWAQFNHIMHEKSWGWLGQSKEQRLKMLEKMEKERVRQQDEKNFKMESDRKYKEALDWIINQQLKDLQKAERQAKWYELKLTAVRYCIGLVEKFRRKKDE